MFHQKQLLILKQDIPNSHGLKKFKKKTDYEEFGGAPLLGVNGVTTIAHGSSKSKAIKNAVRTAIDAVENQMIEKIAGAVIYPSELPGRDIEQRVS